ncbi:hypothetical protein C8R43DRAFT_1140963 [Mycena crocata]|nr:hypothetical protein C8R43DRAFT_1140963 [Mycena crocata]
MHSSLKHLCLRSDAILPRLTLPALVSLDIVVRSHVAFLVFLTWSAPPLNSLDIYVNSVGWSTSQFNSFSRLVPNLTSLVVSLPYSTSIGNFQLIDALTIESPQEFLPNFRYLEFHEYNPDHYQLQELVPILAARRAKLHKFQWSWWSFDEKLIDARAIQALRELVADGMQIHMGSGDKNII